MQTDNSLSVPSSRQKYLRVLANFALQNFGGSTNIDDEYRRRSQNKIFYCRNYNGVHFLSMIFFFQRHAAYSRVDRGYLVLKHSDPHVPRGIMCWVTKLAILGNQSKKRKILMNNNLFPWLGIKLTTAAFTVTRLCPSATKAYHKIHNIYIL